MRALEIAAEGVAAVIDPFGATLVAAASHGEPMLVGPGRVEPELGHHGAVLAPWPNRTAGGIYRFDGREHRLAITDTAFNTAIHGLVVDRPWRVESRRADAVALSIEIRDAVGYPFAVRLELAYAIRDGALRCEASWRNLGDIVAPFGLGFHPYLRPGPGVVDDWSVELDAGIVRDTDPQTKLPLPVRDVTADDGIRGLPLGGACFSRAFGRLARRDGVARVVVRGGGGELELAVSEAFGWVQVFTADVPDPSLRRAGVAVEPQTCPPNALVDGVDLLRLEPGAGGGGWWTLRRTATG